jgi:hypothetical protein
VIAAATHKTKREVEELVAELRPQPPVPSSVRKLLQPTPRASHPTAAGVFDDLPPDQREALAPHISDAVLVAPGDSGKQAQVPRAAITPRAPDQYLVKFTASRATYEKLREAQALLRHQVPSGNVAEIFDRAVTLLLAELRRLRHAATPRPRTIRRAPNTGRHVPAAVKREVWARDGGQCGFVGTAGRCTERGFLEYHHVIPFADGGATDESNLQLRCRAHNAFEVERWSGPGEDDLLREVSPICEGGLSPVTSRGLQASRFVRSRGPELGPGP